MNADDINDDIQFDRLVDGELSGEERRRLLESLDTRPEGWRRCALAFLEAQSWGEELGEIVRPSKTGNKAAVTNVVRAEESSRRQSNLRAAARWLAMAAVVMAAFTLGLMQRERTATTPTTPSATGGQVAVVNPPSTTSTPKSIKPDDALTLWVNDDAGRAQRLRVPLVDADSLDKQLGTQFQSGVPDELRNHLQDRGYNVQSNRRYAPLKFDDGRSMFVPVEDTRIVPASENVVW